MLLATACQIGTTSAPDLCADVECADGEQCVNGECLPDDTEAECVSDADCADGWICLDSLCELDTTQSVCTTDEDCQEGQTCLDGLCEAVSTTPTGLDAENPTVPFDNLVVDQTYALVAPAPSNLEEETSDQDADTTTDDESESETDSASETDTETEADSDTSAARVAPDTCVCTWSVEPTGFVEFSQADLCSADVTVKQAGDATLFVDVVCDAAEETFSRNISAELPVVTCTSDADCGESQVCQESVCIERTGPTIELMTDQSRSPFVVAFDLRIEDAQGDPIPDGLTTDDFRVFEDGVEIEYEETGIFATPAPDLSHQIFLVLDYSRSMETAAAITPMVEATKEFVEAEHLTATQSVGIIEFHDRLDAEDGFGIAVPLTKTDTTGKQTIIDGIPVEGDLESGLSRVWDAVDLAITTLSETERQPGEVHSIVFLTDGKDTTSTADAASVTAAAVTAEINLYPIGFGDVLDKTALETMAESTAGTYFAAASASALERAFADISTDLRGQWNLRYVTQTNTGTANVRVEFSHYGQTGTLESSVNVDEIDADIHQGVIQVIDRVYDSDSNRTEFLLRADYIPRNVSEFRFAFAQDGTTFTLPQSGGLTNASEGWISIRTSLSRWKVRGTEPVAFGSFGNLGTASVPGEVDQVQVMHDDAVYDDLVQPKTMSIGGEAWLAPVYLTVAVDPEDSGSVAASPTKLGYATGEAVTLTATATGDYTFDQWSGAAGGYEPTVTINMDEDASVTAVFHPPHTLTTVVNPEGAGTIVVTPAKTVYKHGEQVTLTAVPTASTFTSWTGASGTATSVVITMDSDKTITANFTTS